MNKSSSVSDFPDLAWRDLQLADVDAIAQLVDLCLKSDAGYAHGLSTMDDDTDRFIRETYLPAAPGMSTGGFDAGGRLMAFASVYPVETAEHYRVSMTGCVHPDRRRRGIGTHLLAWSTNAARRLLESHPSDRPHVLQVSSEFLTETATYLLERHGFEQRFKEYIMRRDLKAPISEAHFPQDAQIKAWAPALVDQFYAVYKESYQTRPGFIPRGRDELTAWTGVDGKGFRPQLSFMVFDVERPIGFICCDEEWVIQVGVLPERRRKGIGSALVNEALSRFKALETDFVMLHVNENNIIAYQMYTRCGFEMVGQRARYMRLLK